jgi:phage-related protein
MYKIAFYETPTGEKPTKDYIVRLASRTDKSSRIKANKIQLYLQVLSEHGVAVGEPYVKHLLDKIWELRPIKDRFTFFKWQAEGYVILHHFIKKTAKTPKREIDQSCRNMIDYIERN